MTSEERLRLMFNNDETFFNRFLAALWTGKQELDRGMEIEGLRMFAGDKMADARCTVLPVLED